MKGNPSPYWTVGEPRTKMADESPEVSSPSEQTPPAPQASPKCTTSGLFIAPVSGAEVASSQRESRYDELASASTMSVSSRSKGSLRLQELDPSQTQIKSGSAQILRPDLDAELPSVADILDDAAKSLKAVCDSTLRVDDTRSRTHLASKGRTDTDLVSQGPPGYKKPTFSHKIRQASIDVERQMRQQRLSERRRHGRGTGSGPWKSTAPSTLPNNARAAIAGTKPAPRVDEPRFVIEHPQQENRGLSVALGPANATWGSDWGLRELGKSPVVNSNISHGVSPRMDQTRGNRRPMSFRPSNLKERLSAGSSGEDLSERTEKLRNTTAGPSNEKSHIKKPSADADSVPSRVSVSTAKWVQRKLDLRDSDAILDRENQVKVREMAEEKAAYATLLKERAKVAKRASRIAKQQAKVKFVHDQAKEDLNQLISSLPELFRTRVLAEIEKNKAMVRSIAARHGGTTYGAGEGKTSDSDRKQSKPLPVPAETEIFHEGAFLRYIERMRKFREEKNKLPAGHKNWEAGHTVVRPFQLSCYKSQVSFPQSNHPTIFSLYVFQLSLTFPPFHLSLANFFRF